MSKKSRSSSVGMARVPEKFVRIGAVADVPWVALEHGNTVQGNLLGLFTRQDDRAKSGRSQFFQVELTAPCKVREGRGEDVEFRQAVAGEIVNLNHNPRTAAMEPFCREILAGAKYEVFILNDGLMDLKNGNTMWNFDVHAHQVRKADEQELDVVGGGDAGAGASEAEEL
jgi:hypothetical protein